MRLHQEQQKKREKVIIIIIEQICLNKILKYFYIAIETIASTTMRKRSFS